MFPDPSNAGAVAGNPQSWNGYAYVTDNPETLTDPKGMNACSPDDKSMRDCLVKIIIVDRSKGKNGKYNDRFIHVKNQKNYNATAMVYVNGRLKGTYLIKTTPSSGKYATLEGGTYAGTRILHDNRYPAILLTGRGMPLGQSPALGGQDPFTGLPYISNAEIHMSGFGNKTGFTASGLAISEGCSVVACSQYLSLESVTGLSAPAPQLGYTIVLDASANGGD